MADENGQQGFLDEMLGDVSTGESAEGAETSTDLGAASEGATTEVVTGTEVASEVDLQGKELVEGLETEQRSEVTSETAQGSSDSETIESLRQQILSLTAQINQGAQRYPEQPKPVEKVGEVAAQVAQVQAPQTAQEALAPYLTAEELDEIIDKPELILTAIQRSNEQVTKSIMSQVQGFVQGEIARQTMITKAVAEFYDANKDLTPYGSFVQHVMQEQEVLLKDKTYGEIFEATASECRKRLGLKAPDATTRTQGKRTNNGERPAFAGTKSHGGKVETGKSTFFEQAAIDLL